MELYTGYRTQFNIDDKKTNETIFKEICYLFIVYIEYSET